MKLKELKRTVNPCWSPCEQYPVMLATGSAAQQVDSSFSSTSVLELYGLNLEDPGVDLELKSSLETQHKFQKLVWSGAGVIVGGCDGGLLEFYSAEKLLKNSSDALLGSSTKHSGHVSALDINPYQKNLLASGASESEIFIWDLNNSSQPMTPGQRSQPPDHVQGLAWNQQVQHILGSTFANRCVVWDLRKNEPIMKLSDCQSRTRWRALAWHPAVATQLVIASDDDLAPLIQLWDLRLAASPLATLEGHNKGVLSLSWSPHDAGLLLSAGKDGRVLCHDPDHTNQSAPAVELWSQPQWVFEAAWSPRAAGLFASASFDQLLALHTLLGYAAPEQSRQSSRNIIDSFGGAASFSQLPAVSAAPPAPRDPPPAPPRAPAWMRRPSGAKLAFGGKLVTFDNTPTESGQRLVRVSQVVSEPQLVERAAQLDAALGSALGHEQNASEQLAEYCRQRGDSCGQQSERYSWFFLRANFLPSFRTEVLNLLGFKQDEIPSKFKSSVTSGDNAQTDSTALSRDAHTLIERKLANIDISGPAASNVVIPNGEDSTSVICRALVCGNLEEAVELCLEAKRVADALIIASLGSQELVYKVQQYYLRQSAADPVALLTGAVLQGAWADMLHAAAPSSWRHTLASLLTHADGDALPHYCEMLGDKLAAESEPSLQEAASICYLCSMSTDRLVSRWAGAGAAAGRGAAWVSALAERALLAARAARLRGRAQEGGKLEAVLEEYAFQLAAQGCLQSALNSLEGAAHSELKQRLAKALGLLQEQRQQPQVGQYSRNRTVSAHSNRRESIPHNQNAYNTVSAPYEHQPWQQSSVPANNAYNNFAPLQPAQLQPAQIQPQPLQPPPRPGSVGPQSGGLTSRSKYKVDPSVASAPLYNQYNFNNQQQQQYGYNSPLPDQYNSTSVANPGYINNNMNSTNSLNPINSTNQINPINPAPLNPANQMNPVNQAPLTQSTPAVNGSYYKQAVEAEPARPVAPGWNDPPMLTSKPKPKQDVPAQAPITHPLFGVEPPQHVPLTGPQYGQQYPGQPYPAQQIPGQYPDQQIPAQYPGQQMPGQYPVQNVNQPNYPPGTQYPNQINQQYQQQGRESPAVAAAPVAKKPIPEQYTSMVNVFESLRNECYTRATQPQMKRKLDDVQKRLETLYDLLRENRLSEGAVSRLQKCACLAGRGDLPGASGEAGALAAGAEFAAVATFLPALKGLLQLAQHLQLR